MKSTLADIRQLFVVDGIDPGGTNLNTTSLAPNTFAIVDASTGITVAPATWTYALLPDEFSIVSNLNGKTYFSFDTIKKQNIKNIAHLTATPAVANVWEARIECCRCIDDILLTINLNEASLIQRDGLTWTHRDYQHVVQPQELSCHCSCNGEFPAYENNVFTAILFDKINASNSPYYEAEIYDEFSATTITPGMDPWLTVTANETDNKDVPTANDRYMRLRIKGKIPTTPIYHDLEHTYVYPRGVQLLPAIQIGNGCTVQFTELTPMAFPIGEGYDLRAEEWENMNYYTNLNFYPQLSDGLASDNLIYQFQNGLVYNTINFEFTTGKVETNNGDKRLFGVMLGAVAGSPAWATLAPFLT